MSDILNSMDLVIFFWVLLFDTPSGFGLSVCMDVACFKWNISSRVNLIGYPDLEL